jgi:hypothetical protein
VAFCGVGTGITTIWRRIDCLNFCQRPNADEVKIW